MKVNDIVNEGLWDDLKAIGQQNQAGVANKLAQATQNVKGQLTPQWYKDFADKAAKAKATGQSALVADSWTQAWGKEFSSMEKANGRPFSDDEYRGLLRNWIEKTAKVKVDDMRLKTMVPVQSLEAVKQYFTNHFIPEYLKLQANPVYVIPDGETVDVVTQVGTTRRGTRYTWSTARGRWADQNGNEVPGYSTLNADLTQQAMEKASNRTSGTSTIGGGGAPTI